MSEKYKSFSERMGHGEPKPIQLKSMDDDLRTGLWNVLCDCFPNNIVGLVSNTHRMFRAIWTNFQKKPADEYGGKSAKASTKKFILSEQWNRVFDLVEFVINNFNMTQKEIYTKNDFIDQCKQILKRENSAYTIIRGHVVEITSEEEIQSIEMAMDVPYAGVKNSIHRALSLLSDRENLDYRNSIKESISAVESLAKEITGNSKGTLGQLTSDLNLHPAFSTGLSKLYGFTSKADGIRHGGAGQPLELDQGTARFMLIICSAFVNYIIQQQDRQN